MPLRAALDVGTNSVLLLVAEAGPGGGLEVVEDLSVITRLGEGLRASGRIGPAGADRTAAAICELAARARGLGARSIRAVGTMCLRTARNADRFVSRVRAECGVRIRIISGAEEARLTFRGVRSELPVAAERLAVFDLGGGSTEFVLGLRGRIQRRLSLDIGAVTSTERFLVSDPPRPEELAALERYLRLEGLAGLDLGAPLEALIGVGGTLTTLAAVELGLERYERDRVHGLRLGRAVIDAQIERLAGMSEAGRAALPGMEPRRADVIVAGAVVVRSILRQLGLDSAVVSDRGLRHGLLYQPPRKPAWSRGRGRGPGLSR